MLSREDTNKLPLLKIEFCWVGIGAKVNQHIFEKPASFCVGSWMSMRKLMAHNCKLLPRMPNNWQNQFDSIHIRCFKKCVYRNYFYFLFLLTFTSFFHLLINRLVRTNKCRMHHMLFIVTSPCTQILKKQDTQPKPTRQVLFHLKR